MNKYLFFAILFTFHFSLQAQNPNIKRTYHWYFGDKAGLDFSSGSPKADTNGQMTVWKGSATMSDTAGNLLFYTDGVRVWNKNHQIMPHGDSLENSYGHVEPTQVIVVPKPGINNLYYIFYTLYRSLTTVELVYAIVDMNQQGGVGDVVSKQNHILNGATEKITAIPKTKSTDIWIITTKFQTNSFYVYLLSNSGMDTIPQGVYNLGKVDNIGISYLKPSLDGTKLSAAFCAQDNTNNGGIELLDFDNNTGIISNPLVFPSCYCESYGVQFSPDGNKLYSAVHYIGTWGYEAGNAIYQYSLKSGDSTSIINSKILLDSIWKIDTVNYNPVFNFCYALQLGSDGKIYGSKNQVPYLRAINYPNADGISCSLVDSAVDLKGRICQSGFPEFLSSYFYTDTSTGILEQTIQKEIINVYPNPIINTATIEISNYNKNIKNIKVNIFDILGNLNSISYTEINDKDKIKLILNAGDLSPGIYLLKVTVDQKIYSQKIIISKP